MSLDAARESTSDAARGPISSPYEPGATTWPSQHQDQEEDLSTQSPLEREAMTPQEEPHFAASELAGLPGMPATRDGVRHRAASEGWPARPRAARGGGSEYPISCLPALTQAALADKVLSAAPASSALSFSADAGASFSFAGSPGGAGCTPQPESRASRDPRSEQRAEQLAALFESKPESIKAEARRCLAIVQEYFTLLDHQVARRAALEVVTKKHAISEATLGRYVAAVKGKPSHLWLYELAPRHVGRTAIADMSAEAWEVLKADYLRKERPSARACIERLRADPRAARWALPSDRTMMRRLEAIPRAVRVITREGREETAKLFPAQVRSRAALHALDIVNGDSYQPRLWVVFDDGEIRRARVWVWQDVYSSKYLSFRVDKSEHTDLIRLSFMDMVSAYGIPRRGRSMLIDNTRAAANKTMSGGIKHRFRFKVTDEEPDGIFKLLGCDVIWATPAHGQSKPVERGFGIGGMHEYIDKAPEFSRCFDESDAYDGKKRVVPVRELEQVVAREIAFLNARKGRRSPIHQGRSFNDVFEESYAKITVRRATEEQLRLLMLASEPVRVQRDGTITLDAGRMVGERRANRYWNKALVDYQGKLVAARFDPARLHEGVHLYTADGRYIGFGECLDPAGFDDQAAGRDWNRNRAAFVRATQQAAEAERRMSVAQMVDGRDAARNLGGAADTVIPAPKVVQPMFRDPLERRAYQPPERTESERAELAHLEAEIASAPQVNVLALRSDADKHAHWKALNARRGAGEQLADADEQFWSHWQTQDYYRDAVAMEADFEREVASRQANAA